MENILEDRYKLNYDLKLRAITDIRFKQGNVDTAVLEVTLFNNGIVADITGEIIEFRFEKPDRTIVYQDTDSGVSVLDAIHGNVQCVLKSNTLKSIGVVRCEIHRAKDGKELITPSFDFKVESSIGEDGILSSNYISIIENELINIRTAENDRSTKEEGRVNAENVRVINEDQRIQEYSSLKSDITTVRTIYATKDEINAVSSQLSDIVTIQNINGKLFVDTDNALELRDFTGAITAIKLSDSVGMIYYIDPTGNDSTGNGTITRPWKSLAKACATVTSGTIHVNAGNYTEVSQCKLSIGVSIEGVGDSSIIKAGQSRLVILLLESAVEGTMGNQEIRSLKFDGSGLTGIRGIDIIKRSNVSIHHCTFIDLLEYAVCYVGKDTVTEPTIYAINNSFHNNVVNNCSKDMGNFVYGALLINGQKSMMIYGNRMIAQTLGRNGCCITGVIGYLDNIKIFNNTLKVLDNSGNWNFAIELWFVHGLEIYNNDIQGRVNVDNSSKGTNEFGVYIHNNFIYQTKQATGNNMGISFDSMNIDTIIKYNEIYNWCSGIYNYFADSSAGAKNIDIGYNLIHKIGGTGYDGSVIKQETGSGAPVCENWIMYNNTMQCYKEADNGIRINASGAWKNFYILNNIIIGASDNEGWHGNEGIKIEGVGSLINLRIQNNNIFTWLTGNITEALVATNRVLMNNISFDSLFVSSSDFHLKFTSPCKSFGVNLGMKLDYGDNTITDTPSLGIYE